MSLVTCSIQENLRLREKAGNVESQENGRRLRICAE
jgi:hypothetical protein